MILLVVVLSKKKGQRGKTSDPAFMNLNEGLIVLVVVAATAARTLGEGLGVD